METAQVLSRSSLLDIVFPQYWKFIKDDKTYKIKPVIYNTEHGEIIYDFDLICGNIVLVSFLISAKSLDYFFSELSSSTNVSDIKPKLLPALVSLIPDEVLNKIEEVIDETIEITQNATYSIYEAGTSSHTFDIIQDNNNIGQISIVIPADSLLRNYDQNSFNSKQLQFISDTNNALSFILGVLEIKEVSDSISDSFLIGKENNPLPGFLQIASDQFIPGYITNEGIISLKKAHDHVMEKNFMFQNQMPGKGHALVKKMQNQIKVEKDFFAATLKFGKIQDIFSLIGKAYIEMPDSSHVNGEVVEENGLILFKKVGAIS